MTIPVGDIEDLVEEAMLHYDISCTEIQAEGDGLVYIRGVVSQFSDEETVTNIGAAIEDELDNSESYTFQHIHVHKEDGTFVVRIVGLVELEEDDFEDDFDDDDEDE